MYPFWLELQKYKSVKIALQKVFKGKGRKRKKGQEQKGKYLPPMVPAARVGCCTPMSAGQSDGHSLGLLGLGEDHETQIPMG